MSGRFSENGRNTGLPSGYRYELNETSGALELWKGGEIVATQSPDGSWFKTSVSTGVGSIHLGGDSGNSVHSVSSVGQNVGFKNEAFNATPGAAIVWFPPWQGASADLNSINAPTYLELGALQSAFAPNGIAQVTGTAYDFTTTITTNLCIASVTARANEAYTGKLTNIIRSSKGVDLHVSSSDVSLTAGQDFTIDYPSLYFARVGDVLRLIIQKDDGQPLQVMRGTTNSQPWRTLRVRTFVDRNVASSHFGDVKDAYNVTDHAGWVLLNGRAKSSLTPTQQAAATSLGIGANIPDARGRMIIGAGGTYGLNETGGRSKINQNDLPNVTIPIDFMSQDNNATHTHSIDPPNTTTTGGTGEHTHPISGQPATESSHTHNVDIGAFPSAAETTRHQHRIFGNTNSINGNATQQVFLPPYIGFAKFMFLGL